MKNNPFVVFMIFISPWIIGTLITGNVLVGALIWLGCVAIYIAYMNLSPKQKRKRAEIAAEQAEIAAITSFDKETRILTVRKRSSLLLKVIEVQESQDITVAHEPMKLHVGSATVGGVTTGGAYTTGGYNYISSSKKMAYVA